MRFIYLILFLFSISIQSEAQVKRPFSSVEQDSLIHYFGICSASFTQKMTDRLIQTLFSHDVVDKQACYNSLLQELKNQELTEQKIKQTEDFLAKYVNDKEQKYRAFYLDSVTHLPGAVKTADGYYYRVIKKGSEPIQLTPQSEIQVMDEYCSKDEWMYNRALTLPADQQYSREVLNAIAKTGVGGEIQVWTDLPDQGIEWSHLSIIEVTLSDKPEAVSVAEDVAPVEDTPETVNLKTLFPCPYNRDSQLSEGYVSILQGVSTASSFFADQNLPQYATDQLLETVWVPRNDEKSLNQSLYSVVMPANYQKVYDFEIYNGHVTDLKKWQEYSRIKELALYINGQFVTVLCLEDTREPQHFQLSSSVADSFEQKELNSVEYRFEIRSLYPGEKYKEPALSEVVFMATNFACIAKGTRVNLYTGGKYAGSKPIEQVVVGDIVQQLSEDRKSYLPALVTKVDRVLHDNMVDLCMDNDAHVLLTDDHPVYVNNKGWCSVNPERTRRGYSHYAAVQLLRAGDEVQMALGSGQVVNRMVRSITSVSQQTETYSLTLESGDNFVAGSIVVGTQAK